MMWKVVVFTVLSSVFAVGLGGMVGGFSNVNINDEGVQNALNFAVVHHNRGTNSAFLSQVEEVVTAQRQVVNGMKYVITVKMARSTCRKNQANEVCAIQEDPDKSHVYGFIYGINRNKPTTLQLVVDSWPDFKVIICRPDPTNKSALDFRKKVSYYSMDEQILRKMLTEENAVDWSTYFLIGGFDFSHAPLLKEVSSDRKINNRTFTLVHLMHLPDINYLLPPAVDSELETRISSLNVSHVDLVNKTWKFGGNEQGFRNIKNLITNFPSGCITDGQGEPVSWILMYDYCAMGLLYTLPEHRGKGYAKVLVSTMAKKLHAEGYPVLDMGALRVFIIL